MIELRFGTAAMARVRFARSALTELLRSVMVLRDEGPPGLHEPWVRETTGLVEHLDLSALVALQPPGLYSPDFIAPPPAGPAVSLADELAAVLAIPPAQVRAEVLGAFGAGAVPDVLAPLVREPERAVLDLTRLMQEYWDLALAPHWPRMRDLLQADILYRARQIADAGPRQLFDDIDPSVRWADGVLTIDKVVEASVNLEDEGLLFVPSVFTWPRVALITRGPWQPTLIYPARGVGSLWDPDGQPADDGLVALLGKSQARLLASLDQPRSTSELARRLGLTAGGVSQHLSVLRNAGLVSAHRSGRMVLYTRLPAADRLLDAPSA